MCNTAMQKPWFAKKLEVLPAHQTQRPRADKLHGVVAVGGAGVNADAELLSVLCAQTVRFCYCVQTLLTKAVFCISSKASFHMHFTIYLVPPCWLHCVLLSSDRFKMQIICLHFPYFAKSVKFTNPISSCFSKATCNHIKTITIYEP